MFTLLRKFFWPLARYTSDVKISTTWKTIDKGLDSLPRAFAPLVQNKTTFGRYVSGLTYDEKTEKISVNWRDAGNKYAIETNSSEFDYVVNAVPFSKVRLWKLPGMSLPI